ncbi:hypothetical protein EGM51_04040 [Verrucomicrobia bacterium S94]|nr:hypothetical protein EGM51_04040 [Verrucomicrobia bacterium S94]
MKNPNAIKRAIEYTAPGKYVHGVQEFCFDNLPQADSVIKEYNTKARELIELATKLQHQIDTEENNADYFSECETLCRGLLWLRDGRRLVFGDVAKIRGERIEELNSIIETKKAPIIERYESAGVHPSLFEQAFQLDDEIRELIKERNAHVAFSPVMNDRQDKAFDAAHEWLKSNALI